MSINLGHYVLYEYDAPANVESVMFSSVHSAVTESMTSESRDVIDYVTNRRVP